MDETFDVLWRNHAMEACGEVSRMRREEAFADVVLCADDQVFKVHRVILAACSSYFERIFSRMGDSKYTPFVILRDTDASLLELVMDFIYAGHVRVPCEKLTGFMALAQGLEVRGLMGIPFDEQPEQQEEEEVVVPPVAPKAKKRKRRENSPGDLKQKSKKVVNKVAKEAVAPQGGGESVEGGGEQENMVEDYLDLKVDVLTGAVNGEAAGEQVLPLEVHETVEEPGGKEEIVENKLFCPVNQGQRIFPEPVAPEDVPPNIPPEISPVGLVRLTSFIMRGKGPDGLPVSFCAVCGYMSPSAQNAIRHERIHTGERPFECHLCNRRFSQSSNYRRHLISIHSASPP